MFYPLFFPLVLLFVLFFALFILLPYELVKYWWQKTPGSKLRQKHESTWQGIIEDNVKISGLVFAVALVVIVIYGCVFVNWKDDTLQETMNGVFVEMFGMMFDILILVVLFNWISAKGEKRKEIKRVKDELYSIRTWKSEEGKIRRRYYLFRLNEMGVTDLDLAFMDLSWLQNPSSLHKIKLRGATLVETNFTCSMIGDADFSEMRASSSKFNGSPVDKNQVCNLSKANFQGSRIQHCEFKGAYLNGAKFHSATLSNVTFYAANLVNVDFSGATLRKVDLHLAEVDKQFLERATHWRVKGDFNIDNYSIRPQDVIRHPGHYKYILEDRRKKNEG